MQQYPGTSSYHLGRAKGQERAETKLLLEGDRLLRGLVLVIRYHLPIDDHGVEGHHNRHTFKTPRVFQETLCVAKSLVKAPSSKSSSRGVPVCDLSPCAE